MNLSAGRILTLFFAACFLAMQLCQVTDVEAVKQNSQSLYTVELDGIVSTSFDMPLLDYPKQYTKAKSKLLNQKAQIAKQRQYQDCIEKQIEKPFVYFKQQSLDLYLYALKQIVSFGVQQQLQLFYSTTSSLYL